jgi:hypothetical protein
MVTAALAALVIGTAALAAPAHAQGIFQWPWDEPAPRPRDTMRQPPPPMAPPPLPPPGFGAPVSPSQAPQGGQWMTRNPICTQLEAQLTSERQRGGQARDALPRLEGEIRQLDRQFHQDEARLERADCYDSFLFSRTLRNTRQCHDLVRQIEGTRRRLADLEAQRQQIVATDGRSYADDIVRELARNNCGVQYQQEAARRGGSGGGSIWQDSEGGFFGGGTGYQASQFATYRTVCVRLCDGYYFPVSFATTEERVQQDAEVCQSKCAAPAELYYHPNPGGAMEQAVAASSQEPYTKLKTAFRYRKEFVQGCSCKENEYVPTAAGLDGPPPPAGSRAPSAPSAPGAPAARPPDPAPQSRPPAVDRRVEVAPLPPPTATR